MPVLAPGGLGVGCLPRVQYLPPVYGVRRHDGPRGEPGRWACRRYRTAAGTASSFLCPSSTSPRLPGWEVRNAPGLLVTGPGVMGVAHGSCTVGLAVPKAYLSSGPSYKKANPQAAQPSPAQPDYGYENGGRPPRKAEAGLVI